MREIKFRAWDKQSRIYRYWEKEKDNILDAIPWDCGDEWTDIHVVEQYTGLKDKNGVEWYEGDKNQYGHVVVFYDGSFMLENPKTSSLGEIHPLDYIIGNIHQPNELDT